MTLQELLEVYNGQYIEIAGTSASNQCVDCANAYLKYVLRLPVIEFTNAVDFPSKAGDAFEYILNTPTGVPKEGDLIIWGGNTWGHIAIFIEGDSNRFTSFEQNYPTGSPCHVQEHTYLSPKVLGWLRPKNLPQSDEVIINELRADRDKNWNLYQGALDEKIKMETVVEQANKTITNITNENTSLKESNKTLANQHSADLEALQRLTNENRVFVEANAQLTKDLKTCHDNCTIVEKTFWEKLIDLFRR